MHRLRYLIGLAILAAALVGAWWVVATLRRMDAKEGLPVQVEFRDARGLRAGADVRYRGVRVGLVDEVRISSDGQKAVVGMLLDAPGAAHARVGSEFWIVAPRFAGLTGGATGLDTLVRDGYVSFYTPPGEASPLMSGSILTGREKPAVAEPEALDDVERGDLLMTLLVPENHGLRPGAAVVFRGMQTGDVRDVALSPEGGFVEVQLRIRRQHRQTVTDKSQFWVARPYVSGALFSGFTVADMSSLVSPYVSYYGNPGQGVLVADGHRAAALASRPDVEPSPVPTAALANVAKPTIAAADGLALVRVAYSAVDKDWLSSDDPIRAEGSGMLYFDRAGRAVVVTARSVVDGYYFATDTFGGDPEIADEQIKVRLADGSVRRAGRVWVDPAGGDLAVLVVEDAPRTVPGTAAAMLSLGDGPTDLAANLSLSLLEVDGKSATVPFAAGALVEPRLGAVVCEGAKAVGIYGRAAARGDAAVLVPLRLLPADLQPQ
ncbi:MAG: Paraquat-inducible protein [Planctomycetota bacterium]|jgi:hypothetical protein